MTGYFYPITPHLAGSNGTPDDRFGDVGDIARVLRSCTLVQEKLDGLNLGLRLHGHRVQAVLKDRQPGGAESTALAPLLAAVAPRLRRLCNYAGDVRVFGELLDSARPALDNWRVFDVFDEGAGRFWAYARVAAAARSLSLGTVDVLHRGSVRSMGELQGLLDTGDRRREGVVLRIESGDWLRERYKFVAAGFEKTPWSLL